MSPRSITRRDFLKVAAAAPLAGAAFPAVTGGSPAPALAPGLEKVRVVLVRDPGPLGPKGAPPAEVVQRMLDDGVKALLGEADIVKAWKSLIRPDDVVGIKTNVANHRVVVNDQNSNEWGGIHQKKVLNCAR